jgi:Aerotolerance regulator N-terminal/von Willebrand factor type A domain
MQFLAPLFFVALAGLAIPVLLHLTQREKKQIVRFPSLMFVRRIPYESVRRRKIHNWLLLMVRLAALALIIFAFARPLIQRADRALPAGTGAREVVVLLDSSYSMGFGDHWSKATAAAKQEIAKLNASDRASVVLFGSSADIQMRTTAEHQRLNASVDAAKPRPSATRFAPALKVAGSILAESSLPRREVVLISDFQRAGWRGEEGARLPSGVTLTPVAIQGAADKPNVTVTGISLARSTFSNQERAVVTAGVVNRTERPVSGATLTLEVNGLPIANKPLSIEPGAAASVTFDAFTISQKNMRGTVRVSDDALAADNAFNFVVSPAEPVHIALVDRGSASSTLFLTRALSIGDAPRFDVLSRQPEALSDEDLRKSAVVLLNDVEVSTGLARRLLKYVEQGGGVFVATGSRATWPQDVDLLPATIGPPVDRTRGDVGRIGALEYGHPIFEVFRAPRSGDFSAVPVYQYRNLTAVKGAQVLARFDAGTPAVLERKVGAGHVVMWGSTLDITWSELPQRPVFLPFVHRSMRHLANYKEPQPWVTVGQVLDPSATAVLRGQRMVLTPSGKRVPIDDEGSEVVELSDQGFYELRGENQNVTVVAVNVDPAEADLTPMDPKEIVAAAVGGTGSPEGAAAAGVPQTPEAKERNQRLWWYLLCGGILLLAADTFLSNRLAKT